MIGFLSLSLSVSQHRQFLLLCNVFLHRNTVFYLLLSVILPVSSLISSSIVCILNTHFVNYSINTFVYLLRTFLAHCFVHILALTFAFIFSLSFAYIFISFFCLHFHLFLLHTFDLFLLTYILISFFLFTFFSSLSIARAAQLFPWNRLGEESGENGSSEPWKRNWSRNKIDGHE